MGATDLVIGHRTEGSWLVISVAGEIDLLTAPRLRDAIAAVMNGSDGPHVLIDLSEVTFLDSSGLGVLVAANRIVRASHRRFGVAARSRPVLSVLNLTGLDKVFEVFGDADEAIRSG